MGTAANVEFIVQTEPWRSGLGKPRNAIDPIWAGDTVELCPANEDSIEWEPDSDWWWCRQCGHCSNLHYLVHHVVESPRAYYELSMKQFLTRRKTQGFPSKEAEEQAFYIMGIALRVAASERPEELSRLADKILRLCE